MKWRQLILLILTIWTAEFVVHYALENIVPRKIEYRTVYLPTQRDDLFHGRDLTEFGEQGWELINVIPNGNDEVVCFFKRQTVIKWY